jgi:hypothetical protein
MQSTTDSLAAMHTEPLGTGTESKKGHCCHNGFGWWGLGMLEFATYGGIVGARKARTCRGEPLRAMCGTPEGGVPISAGKVSE